MKTRMLPAFCVVLLVCGCQIAGPEEATSCNGACKIGLALESGFDGDYVEARVDGTLVFADTVTTHSVLGVADVITLEMSEGVHEVQLRINEHIEARRYFSTSRLRSIGVAYERGAQRITFSLRDFIVLYH